MNANPGDIVLIKANEHFGERILLVGEDLWLEDCIYEDGKINQLSAGMAYDESIIKEVIGNIKTDIELLKLI